MQINLRTLIIVLLLSVSNQSLHSQTMANYDFSGYFQSMELFWINNGELSTMNTTSNRLNFNWYLNQNLKTHIAMRNIVSFGTLPRDFYPHLANTAKQDLGKMDLTFNLSTDTSHFAYSQFDRAQLQYSNGNFEITVGRQRINWGINLVWTPNDIFNSFNYLDFDYAERAGSDAVLVQYYTGMASSIQFAYKLDHEDRATYAALYRFNQWNYDFQFLAGVLDQDYVFGGGWTGQIKSAGFLGEATYFHSKKDEIDSTNTLVASISANYTFKNSLFIQASILFNSSGTNDNAGQGNLIATDRPLSAKDFTRAKYAIFGQLSFPFTPLIKADLSGIFNPGDKSVYLGPSLFFSLSDNIEFMIIGQFFIGQTATEYGDYGTMLFSRLKWSF